jgi:hypothetical protein
MSNTTTVAMAVMAMGVTVASVPPAAATNNGVSEKTVRAIVKKEIAKISRVRGPRGPAGPAGPPGPPGMDGVQGRTMWFAHIFSNGEVDQGGRGISQENVLVGEIVDPEVGPDKLHRQYCLVGLPPPLGGQVSGDLDPGDFDANDEHLWLTEDGACVVIDSPPDSPRFTGFHVLLLY